MPHVREHRRPGTALEVTGFLVLLLPVTLLSSFNMLIVAAAVIGPLRYADPALLAGWLGEVLAAWKVPVRHTERGLPVLDTYAVEECAERARPTIRA